MFSRTLVNNHIFFQHPDLIRVLKIHENVMAVMMNTLGRRAQTQNESAPEGEVMEKEKVNLYYITRFLRNVIFARPFVVLNKI